MERRALDEFVERARGFRRRAELDAATAGVLDAFDAAEVQSLLLKGPALARLLYTPDEHRGYSDVDLLVPPNDLPAARRVLGELAFHESSARAVFGVDDVSGVLDAETWTRRGDWGPVLIDLHWRLPGCEAPAQIAWEALARRRTWIDLDGRDAAVLDRGGLALHLATHAAQHGPEDLKAIGDLARGVERWPSEVWRSAARLAGEVEAMPAFAAGLRLLPEGAAIAGELGLPSSDEVTWKILHREARPRGTFHLKALAEARGARARADVLRRSLLPTPRWIARRHPWAARGGAWLIAGYTAHLLRAPGWAMRAWLFRRRARRAAD